jgi:periplasmic protein TonB
MAYAEKRAANPGALGLTIGLNACAVLALAAWNPDIVRIVESQLKIIKIRPIDPPPPEQTDKVQPKTKQVIDTLERTVETKTAIDDWRPEKIEIKPFTAGGGGIVDGGDIVEPPKPPVRSIVKTPPIMATPANDLQPPYPPSLQRQGVEGSITVRILVGNDGRPKDIVLVRADDPGFFAAAKSWGMRHWRFKPAAEDDAAVEGWYTLTVKFNIE